MSSVDTRATLKEFDRRMANGEDVASLFAEDASFEIPGATEIVPWIGERTGRAAVGAYFAALDTEHLVRDHFTVERTFADGEFAVRTGRLRSQVRTTGVWMELRFAIELTIKDGLITHYFMHEDSWEVAEAVRAAKAS